jgi:hypothetical protein
MTKSLRHFIEALLINRYDSQVTDDFAAANIAAGLAYVMDDARRQAR